jgi:hypothetical protein
MSFSATARWRVLGPGDEVDLSIEITHGGLEHIDPILELTESAIAVEAQQPANLARLRGRGRPGPLQRCDKWRKSRPAQPSSRPHRQP